MSSSKKLANPIVLQDRDLNLLKGLFESRVMTAEHIAAIYFAGSKEAAKKRLQKLKAAGFVGERARRTFEPAVLILPKNGLVLLREKGILAEYPAFALPFLDKRARVSDITLRHELEVMDVKAAFHATARKTEAFSIAEFGTWPRLYEFEASKSGITGASVLVKPDGFIRIHENESDGGLSEHTFFLEVDRSTETQDTLVSRAACYLDYYKSGGFAERNGAARSALKDFPFRVLMVFKTAERRNNTAERLLLNSPAILTHVCLATIAEVKRNPFGPVWFRPIDYRMAVLGTPFDPERQAEQRSFQRQTARDVLIEQKVVTHHLLN